MLGHYLTVALRNLGRHKASTVIKILALALGLTCFLGAYIVSDYFESIDGHFEKSDRITVIRQQVIWPNSDVDFPLFVASAGPLAKYLRTDFPELAAVARRAQLNDVPIRAGEHKSYRWAEAVDGSFLEVFDLPFIAGDSVEALSKPESAILSADAATAIFGTTDVVGRTITVRNQIDVTVTGVISEIPAPSHLGRTVSSTPFEILFSMDVADKLMGYRDGTPFSEIEDWTSNPYTTYALLPADDSLTLAQLNEGLSDFGERHIPESEGGGNFDAIPLSDYMLELLNVMMLGDEFGLSLTTLLYLFGALILAVACLDFVNLATAESTRRAKEIGMRKTMGASRGHVTTQTLLEVTLLVAAALGLALLAVAAIIDIVNRPVDLGFRLPSLARPDFWVFLLGVLAVASLAAGGYPALVLSRIRPIFALRAGGVRAGPKTLRTILVGIQFAVASFLLIAVILIFAQMSALRDTALAQFEDRYVFISTPLTGAGVEFRTFQTELTDHPAVKAVTAAERPPWTWYSSILDFTTSPDPASERQTVNRLAVAPDYFATMGIDILAGRSLAPGDTGDPTGFDFNAETGSQRVNIIIDRDTAADFGWTNPQAAVGETIYAQLQIRESGQAPRPRAKPATIVGVAENVPFRIRQADAATLVYHLQPDIAARPIVRLDKTAVQDGLAHIDAAWAEMAPTVPLRRRFADDLVEQALGSYERLNRTVLGLAVFGVIIATMGLFGIATHIVERRTHEIGVRKTLGARTGQVLGLLLWDFAKPVVIANLIAWPVAYVAAQMYLSQFATRIPLTPVPFVLSLAITLLVAWAAVAGQAWRAARVNPAQVLRYE